MPLIERVFTFKTWKMKICSKFASCLPRQKRTNFCEDQSSENSGFAKCPHLFNLLISIAANSVSSPLRISDEMQTTIITMRIKKKPRFGFFRFPDSEREFVEPSGAKWQFISSRKQAERLLNLGINGKTVRRDQCPNSEWRWEAIEGEL